jgi:hypothetical protein
MATHCPTRLRGPYAERSDWLPQRGCRPATTIRHELVDRIKAEIAAGTYDTPERFEAALAVMARRLAAK